MASPPPNQVSDRVSAHCRCRRCWASSASDRNRRPSIGAPRDSAAAAADSDADADDDAETAAKKRRRGASSPSPFSCEEAPTKMETVLFVWIDLRIGESRFVSFPRLLIGRFGLQSPAAFHCSPLTLLNDSTNNLRNRRSDLGPRNNENHFTMKIENLKPIKGNTKETQIQKWS